jgi:hypothetical protein
MVHIGNHLKMTLPRLLRGRAREFYEGLLGCKILSSPRPDLDLYEFAGGFVLGLFFVPEAEVLSEADHAKAAWMELKTERPEEIKARLVAFGVRPIEYPDTTRFYFQAPGGQVFRLVPMDGGL